MTRKELIRSALYEAAQNKPATLYGMIDTLIVDYNIDIFRLSDIAHRQFDIPRKLAFKTIIQAYQAERWN